MKERERNEYFTMLSYLWSWLQKSRQVWQIYIWIVKYPKVDCPFSVCEKDGPVLWENYACFCLNIKLQNGGKKEEKAIHNSSLSFFFFFFRLHCTACLILVVQPGIEPLHPGVGLQSPNRGTARELSQANLGRKDEYECPTWRRGCPDICERQRWKVTGKKILNGIFIVLKVMQRLEPVTANMVQKLKVHLS